MTQMIKGQILADLVNTREPRFHSESYHLLDIGLSERDSHLSFQMLKMENPKKLLRGTLNWPLGRILQKQLTTPPTFVF